jgi:hypothetical protein
VFSHELLCVCVCVCECVCVCLCVCETRKSCASPSLAGAWSAEALVSRFGWFWGWRSVANCVRAVSLQPTRHRAIRSAARWWCDCLSCVYEPSGAERDVQCYRKQRNHEGNGGDHIGDGRRRCHMVCFTVAVRSPGTLRGWRWVSYCTRGDSKWAGGGRAADPRRERSDVVRSQRTVVVEWIADYAVGIDKE